MTDIELVLDARANLGEGPVWDDRSGVLVWLDIMAGAIHRYDPATGADSTIDVGQPVGGLRRAQPGDMSSHFAMALPPWTTTVR